jgi:hypothetical protein
MARKKDPPKPLMSLKHDFADALDNAIHQGGMLLQAVEFVLRVEDVKLPPNIRLELDKAAKGYRAAIYGEGSDG